MSVVQEILAGSSARSAKGSGDGVDAEGGVDAEAGRTAGRGTAVRALRPSRAPAAALVACVIALAGWVLAAVLVAVMLGMSLPLRLPPRLLDLTPSDPAVRAAAAAMIVCGVVLVALALVPGRPRLVPLRCQDPRLAMGLTRSGLRRTLAAGAREVDGVHRACVHILRRRIEVTVVADADTTGALLREVGAAVGDRLAGLGVRSRHEVVVRLRRRGA